ncbi:XdhC family protein [Cytobacillus massiliigabonensis]|uniref:XdhC family protein n=1 Tax=Cytobacillus massiliigabonensis TaxID=1871011 RepID=UPI000C8349B4|nr:XdhC family protein [Cytobacillus massiliigabonensis]
MNDSLFIKLSESIKQRKEIFLLTITDCDMHELIGFKALLLPMGEFYADSPSPISLQQMIMNHAEKLVRKKRSGTFTFTWNGSLVECFAEYFPVPIHLIIAGAGHVCEPVARIGKMLGFYVTVIDDREDFANRDRFPHVDEVICQSFLHFFKKTEITAQTYILLLTRGHKYDVLSLQELLNRKEKPAYIGMIGSRRRISGVFEQLKGDFPNESFDQLFTPVGLDIGAQTPEEIAISILAEILKLKNQSSGSSLSLMIRKYTKLGFREGAIKWNSFT